MGIERYLTSTGILPKTRLSSRFAELLPVLVLVAIIVLIIMPLPLVVMDMLIGINIAFGVLLLLNALYIKGPLDFSSFPAILLVSTVFRLALTIAATRLILGEGHAGAIVQTFGTMVAGGSIVVGLVMFMIITIVQFIVLAKGAERVAEVAARFSLDSMPGKQLSIDSDLRSGLIDKDEARRRRRNLEQESKLHGALDGAMKFVKGEAIASIVIVVINLVGGLAIGVMQRGMSMGEATKTYSILSIGEGLVAQLPALMSALAAGLIVTRATDEENGTNLGQAIQGQLSANPQVLLFAGGISLLMALIPGFPAFVFVGLGLGSLLAGASVSPTLKPLLLRHSGPMRKMIARGQEAPRPATLLAQPTAPKPVVPLLLELSGPRPSAEVETALADALTAMLDRLQYRSGVPLPRLAIHFVASDAAAGWQLLAFELPAGRGEGHATDAVVAGVEGLIRRNLHRFLGVQEAVSLLNRVGEEYPEVVKEAVRAVPAARIAEVLRRLVEEEVPLRNMRDVLEGLTDAAGQERETPKIADLTRIALKHYLLDTVTRDGLIRALVVTPELETMIREAVRLVDGVERLAVKPEVARDLVAAIAQTAESTQANIVVTSFEIRRAVRRLIEPDLFDLPVMAFNELSPTARIEIVGQIGAPQGALTNEAAQPAIAAE